MKNYTLFPENCDISQNSGDENQPGLFASHNAESVPLASCETTQGERSALDAWAAGFEAWKPANQLRNEGSLSTAHISPDGELETEETEFPCVEWDEGASNFRVSKGGKTVAVGGGKRGKINSYSAAARRRFLRKFGKVKRDEELPCFATLTYHDKYPSPRESKDHLDIFQKRFHRKFPKAGVFWKLEPQERGAPHFHFSIWGVDLSDLRAFIPACWSSIVDPDDGLLYLWHLGKLGNGNRHCVQQAYSFRGVLSYMGKYLGKAFKIADWEDTGRFWGVWYPENIPFGESKKRYISLATAIVIMRYQRRFSKIRKSGRSLTIFCDASQWVNRLL